MSKKPLKVVYIAIVAATMLMAPAGIYAQSGNSPASPGTSNTPDTTVQQQPGGNGQPNDPQTTQLNDRACQALEEKAVNHMDRLADFTERQLELFSTIAERVDEFYQQNELEAEGYDEHMDSIDSLAADAGNLTDDLRESTDSFECGQEDASQHIGDFRTKLQESKDSLENLRQAIREQILLVKGALSGDSATDENEETLETSEAENGQE